MDFRDSNGTAAGNMARAGNSFWSNLMGLRQQNAQLPGQRAVSQQQQTAADIASQTEPDAIQQQKEATAQAGQKTKAGQFGIDDMVNRNYLRGAISDPSKSDVADQFPATPAPVLSSAPVPASPLGTAGDSSNPFMNPASSATSGSMVSPSPVTPRVSPADPSIPFSQQAPEVQQARINKIIAQKPPGSVPLAPSEVAAALYGEEYARKNAGIPPLNAANLMSGGLQPVSAEINGVKFAQPGVTEMPGQSGKPSGFIMVNGEAKPNPNFISPKDVLTSQDSLADIENTQQQLQSAKDSFTSHPEVIGPSSVSLKEGIKLGGTSAGQVKRHGQANLTGGSPAYTAQNNLSSFLSSETKNLLSEVHIGRITELELGLLQGALPSLSDPPEKWNDYFKLRSDILNKKHSAMTQQLKQNGTPVGTLPSVGNPRAGQIVSPGSARTGDSETMGSSGASSGAQSQTIKTKAEYDALPKGQKFNWAGSGRQGPGVK